jgi:hypothetical protein
MDLYGIYDKLEKKYGKQERYNDYLNKLVQSYINGEDVEDIAPLENLEDNPDFMLNVILETPKSDKYDFTKVLKLASDNVKKDYYILDACLDRYYERPDVLIELCKEFIRLNKTGDPEKDNLNVEVSEIIVRTIDIVKRNGNPIEDYLEDLNELGLELNSRYAYVIEIFNNRVIKDDNFGFMFAAEKYKNNRYLLPFIARKTFERILEDDRVDARLCILASKCNSVDDVDKVILPSFSAVLKKDEDLSNYVLSNRSVYDKLMKCLKKEVEKRIIHVSYIKSSEETDPGVNPGGLKFVNKHRKIVQ